METGQPQTISTDQLAELADCPASILRRHRADLPATVAVPTGQPGRPVLQYDLNTIADKALELTAELSDAECRIQLALVLMRQKAKRSPIRSARSISLYPSADGGAELQPHRPLTRADILSLISERQP